MRKCFFLIRGTAIIANRKSCIFFCMRIQTNNPPGEAMTIWCMYNIKNIESSRDGTFLYTYTSTAFNSYS